MEIYYCSCTFDRSGFSAVARQHGLRMRIEQLLTVVILKRHAVHHVTVVRERACIYRSAWRQRRVTRHRVIVAVAMHLLRMRDDGRARVGAEHAAGGAVQCTRLLHVRGVARQAVGATHVAAAQHTYKHMTSLHVDPHCANMEVHRG